jgi:transcriptional regulatory protein RtcR
LVEAGFIPGRLLQSAPPRGGRPTPLQTIDLDLAKYDRLRSRFQAEQQAAVGFLKGGIATRNPAFNALIDRIERVALASAAPLLLTGPTGAGKSKLARRITELKRSRRLVAGPLVEVNCATLRGDGAMSALFGHTRGAFTGATEARKGLLVAADKGILFLDEIGELGLDEQAMLLRAIEERRFLPFGADKEVASDFQLIAGTNRDLHAEVRAGRFREDLLARIDLWTFRMPGLAERPEDIAPNLDFELEQQVARSGRQVRFQREARDRFLAFAERAPWPANFRDLNAAVTRLVTLADAGRIDVAGVEDEIARLQTAWGAPSPRGTRVAALFGDAPLDRFDQSQLEDVLAVCATARSLSEAGRLLFAVSREQKSSTNDADRLRKYLARFGLAWADLPRS